jgi:hypothetical protein
MYEQLQDAAKSSGREPRISQPIYTRPMPGGGYVRVEVLESEVDAERAEYLRGRVVLERRSPAPATPEDDHVVVEELEGDDPNVVMSELFRIARDNAAIARRVLRRQQPIQRAD